MLASRLVLVCALFVVSFAACSTRVTPTRDVGSGGGDDDASGGGDIDTGGGGGPVDAGADFDACGAATGAVQCTSIYTITGTQPPALFRFDPACGTFEEIGPVMCTGSGPLAATPYSMAVSREGVAWVVYTNGRIYNVDVQTAACTPTTYMANQMGFTEFGMGFASDAVGATTETLYVSRNAAPYGLARIDTTSLVLTPIGNYDGASGRAELTGTGDARLFGAFEGTPFVVAEIERTSGHILSTAPQAVGMTSSNFAFAAYGGDFYLFVGPGAYTDVYRYRPRTGESVRVVSNFDQEVVGAGVSTCAPTGPF